ncbi:MAG: alpha/beta hydrolase, partial [Ilumatobacteraceae bacterium]
MLRSADGTSIGWSRTGDGPPIVMVSPVMASRARGPQLGLPAALAEHYTVFTYDRRGTGESGETPPYAPEREFEDLQAMLELAGADASVYGFSSGATLALLAAAHGLGIARLLLLEPPLVPDPDLEPREEARRRLDLDRADARRWFDEEIVGIPAEVRAQFPPLTDADLANAPAMLHELTFLPGT